VKVLFCPTTEKALLHFEVFCPSDKSSLKEKMSVGIWWNNSDRVKPSIRCKTSLSAALSDTNLTLNLNIQFVPRSKQIPFLLKSNLFMCKEMTLLCRGNKNENVNILWQKVGGLVRNLVAH
jgi:hypothetical protein